jgi:hypothetical protein
VGYKQPGHSLLSLRQGTREGNTGHAYYHEHVEVRQDYNSATSWMLDAMGNPSGPRWVQAHGEALKAVEYANGDVERLVADRLFDLIARIAPEYGYHGLS